MSSKEQGEVQDSPAIRVDFTLRDQLLRERALAANKKYVPYLFGEEDFSITGDLDYGGPRHGKKALLQAETT